MMRTHCKLCPNPLPPRAYAYCSEPCRKIGYKQSYQRRDKLRTRTTWADWEFEIVRDGRNDGLTQKEIHSQLKARGSSKSENAINGVCRRLKLVKEHKKPHRMLPADTLPTVRTAAEMKRERFMNPADCRYGR